MRKKLILTLALSVAVGGAVVASTALAGLGPTVFGPDGNTQAIAVKLLPNKLSNTKATPVALDVTTKTTSTTNANGVPSPAVRAVVDFAKGAKVFAKGLPTCDPGKLQNVSTDEAVRVCGRAKIGGGTATALIPIGTQVFVENTIVTAFNGRPQGKKPTVLLHTYGEAPVQVTLVLTGVVSNRNKQGYGPRLDIGIPLIAGGTGALTDFHAKINKRFKYKGKKRSFVTAIVPRSRR